LQDKRKIKLIKQLSRIRIGQPRPAKPLSPKSGRKTYKRSTGKKVETE
jgi:hypothetical protein